LASSHAIHALDDRTAAQAIDEGVPIRRVWTSLCDDLDVPEERRSLADAKAARRRN
jgi:flagellar biosynthesis regulator FlaF